MTDDTIEPTEPAEGAASPLLDAFGGYTQTLREAARLSYVKAGAQMGVAYRTLFRIDKGGGEPGLLMMHEYLQLIGGTLTDLDALAALPTPTRADGEARARARIQQRAQDAQAGPQLPVLLGRIRAAAARRPDLLPRLEGYLDALGVEPEPPA